MGTGVNKLRYSYYGSFHFYYFLGGVLGEGTAAIFVAFFLPSALLPIPAILCLSGLAGALLTFFVLKMFLCIARRPFLLSGAVGGLVALIGAWASTWVITGADTPQQISGGILFVLLPCVVVVQLAGAKRIKLYPDRVSVGKLVLYYQDMKEVKWGVGSLERTRRELTPGQQAKPLKVLTPLLFESHDKDFSISYYYTVIEMPKVVYVIQPVFWRNSLAQNLRNGWIETWRWDGSTEPPAGWVKPS